MPIVLSSLLGTGACPVPPSGTPTIGQTCSFWYDNDRLGGGNFAFLSLDPAGWDVASDAQCNPVRRCQHADRLDQRRTAGQRLAELDRPDLRLLRLRHQGSWGAAIPGLERAQGAPGEHAGFPDQLGGPGISGSRRSLAGDDLREQHDRQVRHHRVRGAHDRRRHQPAAGRGPSGPGRHLLREDPNADVAPGVLRLGRLGDASCAARTRCRRASRWMRSRPCNVPGRDQPDDLRHHAEHPAR